jgi:hypothetical protein
VTFDELYTQVLAVLPEATIGEDNDGQLIVYTAMRLQGDGTVAFIDPICTASLTEPVTTQP